MNLQEAKKLELKIRNAKHLLENEEQKALIIEIRSALAELIQIEKDLREFDKSAMEFLLKQRSNVFKELTRIEYELEILIKEYKEKPALTNGIDPLTGIPIGVENADGEHQGMVWIPEGKFLYSFRKEEKYTKGFWIDIQPITNELYKNFILASGHRKPEYWNDLNFNNPKQPVVGIRWEDVIAYAEWNGKRLPTEEEWEKAARGIDGRTYPWGERFDHTKCNTQESAIGKTTSIGQFINGISPYGCYDMAGNVWERIDSWYTINKYRVLRGASWNAYGSSYARCAYRMSDETIIMIYDNVGFRCVCDE